MSKSAFPEYISVLVLPWIVIADTPACSAILANSVATICSQSQPFLIFNVTGLVEFFTTAFITFSACSMSSKSLLPSPFFTTLGAGHPMFISTISANFDTYFAAYPIVSSSLPNICILIGLFSPSVFISSFVFESSWNIALLLIISVHTKPGPNSLHIFLNDKSVTPAIGANIKLFSSSTFPILNFFKYIFPSK